MEGDKVSTVRDTPLGECIGATILDITAVDTEEFLRTKDSRIFIHLSNGMTIFVTMGTENPGLIGILGDEDDDCETDQASS